jgi:hypothetical protein
MKNSVMNNNDLFDYTAFLELETDMKSKDSQGSTVASVFSYTFT